MSDIVKLIKARIDNLNMKTFHVITDYMVEEGFIKEENIKVIYHEIADMNTNMDKHSVIFEIAAFNLGLITEEQLKNIITSFRGIEIVNIQEMREMQANFNSFPLQMCQKYQFFEAKNTNSSTLTKNIIVAFTYADKINTLLKRTISEFRIRYTLPLYIEQFLKEYQ